MTEFIVTGQIIYVDVDATGANDGSSWANAYNYLQNALAIANSISVPVEIRVAKGIYTPDSNSTDPNGSGDREATFQLISGVTLKGGYARFGEPDPNTRDIDLYETILSGDLDGNDVDVNDRWDLWNEPSRAENSYHVVMGSGTDSTAELDGFTITGGNANGGYYDNESRGGGMYTDCGGPTVINCTFNGNSALRGGAGMYNSSSVLRLINCTFQANVAKDSGGIHNQTSDLTFINCAFSGNKAMFGVGGMGIYDSNATLTDCAFSGNTARCIVGGLGSSNSNVTLTNCRFTGNSVPWPAGMGCGLGGGIVIDGGKAILTDCIFSGNSARWGGGMFHSQGSLTVANCIFSGNFAYSYGGGMVNGSGSIPTTLTNCTFSGNFAYSYGGGIRNSGNATLTNCTFSDNSSMFRGGGIYNSGSGSATLTNCILWGNTAARGPQAELGGSSALNISYCCIEGGQAGIYDPYQGLVWGPGNIEADPCFAEPGYWEDPCNTPDAPWDDVWVDGDYHLLPDSPCIDAADPNYVAEPNETDLDGKPRVIGSRIDMGAFEYSPPVPAEADIDPDTLNLQSKGKWITCYLCLPEDYNVADIDPNSVLLQDEIEPERFRLDEEEQVAIVKFRHCEVQAILNVGQVELTISGQLTNGTLFEATDIIRVIDKGGKK